MPTSDPGASFAGQRFLIQRGIEHVYKPFEPISGIRLSNWLHRKAHDGTARVQALEARSAHVGFRGDAAHRDE